MTADWVSFDVSRWMLAATAFGALLAGGALAVERVQRIGARATRGVWAVALGAAVAWPLIAVVWLTRPLDPLRGELGAAIVGGVRVVDTPLSMTWLERATAWWMTEGDATLLLVWGALSGMMTAQLLRALWKLRAAARLAERTEVLGESVLVSDVVGPAVFGVWRPRVVIPQWVLELDPLLQSLVLRHEREHCEGRDSWLVWLAVVSTTLVPWNLAAWYLSHRLRLAMEVDCDARTLRAFPDRRTAYARLLLFIAQRSAPIRIAPALAHLPSHLSRRIAAMTTVSFARPTLQRATAGAAFVALIAAACSRPVAGNLAGPAPVPQEAPAAVAPAPAAVPRLSTADSTTRANAPWFDFQVEKAATMKAGARGPRYPDALRAAKTEGSVLAQFVVGTDGVVDMNTFKVLKTDHDDFTAAVREALATMTFDPAQVKGKTVKQLVQMPFAFRLSKDAAAPSAPVLASVPAPTPTPSVAAVDREATMLATSAAPIYPAALREARVEGQVLVMVVVNADGTPDMASFKVLKTDREEFADAVHEAVRNTRWTPAMKDGRAVRQLVRYPYAFRLAK